MKQLNDQASVTEENFRMGEIWTQIFIIPQRNFLFKYSCFKIAVYIPKLRSMYYNVKATLFIVKLNRNI